MPSERPFVSLRLQQLLIFPLFLLATFNVRAVDSCLLSVIVETVDTSQSAGLTICGSTASLAMWNPTRLSLQQTEPGRWVIELYEQCPLKLEYKITRGSWETEATDEKGLPLPNFRLNLVSDTLIRHQIDYWKVPDFHQHAGGVTGELQYIENLTYDGLLPRKVAVWLPPMYHKDSLRRYPVLYMHDGQNLFDPAQSIFGIDWGLDEAADSLIRHGLMEPVIIVGIYNSPDRMKEYWVGDTGSRYRHMLIHRLKPLIDSLYRTKPGWRHTAIGGSSAGGLAAFISLWEQGDVYSKALCFSPAFVVRGDSTQVDYVEKVRAEPRPHKGQMVYIWNGGLGIDSVLAPGVRDMIKLLGEKGFREGRKLRFRLDDLGEHTESHWRREVPAALKWLFAAHP